MPAPQTNFAATGVAQDAVKGTQTLTFNPTAEFQGNNELSITFSATSDADIADVNIIPKVTNVTPGTLATGLSVSGSFTWPQFLQLIQRDRLYVKGMKMQTDNVANYSTDLRIGETRYDNVDVPQIVSLVNYRRPTGNGYSDTLEINDKPFVIKARFFMQLLKLIKGSYLKVTFIIAGTDSPTMIPVK